MAVQFKGARVCDETVRTDRLLLIMADEQVSF